MHYKYYTPIEQSRKSNFVRNKLFEFKIYAFFVFFELFELKEVFPLLENPRLIQITKHNTLKTSSVIFFFLQVFSLLLVIQLHLSFKTSQINIFK